MKIFKNKTLVIIIISLLILFICSSNAYAVHHGTVQADGGGREPISQRIVNPDDYDPSLNPLTVADSGKFIDVVNVIVGSIRVLGTIIAVIALVVIGIKYMVGSVEEKANFKETMVPYIIGAVMVFAIPNILGILYDIVKSMKM